MAEHAAAYLLADRGLYCSYVDDIASPSRSITVAELAVLAENKAYEHPASEIEQLPFTRGGADGDPLGEYATSDRIIAISSLGRRTHHEARNALKHRAHPCSTT